MKCLIHKWSNWHLNTVVMRRERHCKNCGKEDWDWIPPVKK